MHCILFLCKSTLLWKLIRFEVYYLLSACPAFSESATGLLMQDVFRTVPSQKKQNQTSIKNIYSMKRLQLLLIIIVVYWHQAFISWCGFTVHWIYVKLGRFVIFSRSFRALCDFIIHIQKNNKNSLGCPLYSDEHTPCLLLRDVLEMSPRSFCCLEGCRVYIFL